MPVEEQKITITREQFVEISSDVIGEVIWGIAHSDDDKACELSAKYGFFVALIVGEIRERLFH